MPSRGAPSGVTPARSSPPSDASPSGLGDVYAQHFHGHRRERLFLSSVAFFVTFGLVRMITHAIRAGVGPFHNMEAGGTHIHHLVWGILLLLLVGYLWLAEVGTGAEGTSIWVLRLSALLYGVGAALTLDEFALWLNLEDVYWDREGRESLDAIALFGAGLSVGFWGGPFLHAVARLLLAPAAARRPGRRNAP